MKKNYYIFSSGRLRRKHHTLFLEKYHEAGEVAEKIPIPVEQVDALYLLGEIELNSRLVSFLGQQHIVAHFFDYHGNYTGSIYPREYLHSGRLRVQQVQHYLDGTRRGFLARAFVRAALQNMLHVLSYYYRRGEVERKEVIAPQRQLIQQELKRLASETEIPAMMACEGRARQAYYAAWPAILRAKRGFFFTRRNRRPPRDEVNALISFGNMLCYTVCLKQIYHTALDPTISYLHEPGERRFSLALDVSEVFKPILVDRLIFRLVNRGQLSPDHFEEHLGGVFLNERGRQVFVRAWNKRLNETVAHERLKRQVRYERLVRFECYKLVRHLLEEETYEGFMLT